MHSHTIQQCEEIIRDEKYTYLECLNEWIDTDQAEGTLRAIAESENEHSTDRDLLLFAKSLRTALNDAIMQRAERLHEKSVNPLLDSYFDDSKAQDLQLKRVLGE